MNVRINRLGITKCSSDWRADNFIRVHHCIMYLLEGEAHYFSDDEDIIIKPGHLYITPINKAYSISQNPLKLMNQLWIHIDGVYKLPNIMIDIDLKYSDIIKNILLTVESMITNNIKCEIIEKQLEIMLEALDYSTDYDIRIKNIMDYIAQNYHKKVDNAQMAQSVYLDKDYLGRLFKNKTGLTLQKYIEKYRIEKACKYILQNKALEELSPMVGYNDVKAFLRAFKRNKGVTVSEFRKSRFLQL